MAQRAAISIAQMGALPPKSVLPFGARPIQDWLVLSGKGLVDPWANPFQVLDCATFVAELRLPLPRGKVLINLQTNQGIQRSFALFVGPDGALSLLHREGAKLLRASLPAVASSSAEAGRLTYFFDSAKGNWMLRLTSLTGNAPLAAAQGMGAMAFANRDAEDICKKGNFDPAVLWFGFSRCADVPRAAPWIGLRTVVDTTLGPVAAGNLKAGDMIMTTDRGPQTLRAVHTMELPARGSFAPILLRAPFYDRRGDVLVSADQRLVVSGSAVEYLFGTESVLVAAGDVVDGRTAVAEDRRAVVSTVCLDLGGAALIGCAAEGEIALAVGDYAQTCDAPLMCLNSYETVALMRMLGRIVTKAA